MKWLKCVIVFFLIATSCQLDECKRCVSVFRVSESTKIKNEENETIFCSKLISKMSIENQKHNFIQFLFIIIYTSKIWPFCYAVRRHILMFNNRLNRVPMRLTTKNSDPLLHMQFEIGNIEDLLEK